LKLHEIPIPGMKS